MPDYDVVEMTNKGPNPPPAAEVQAERLGFDLRSDPLMRLAPPADALKAGRRVSVLDRARVFQPARAVNSLLHLQRRYGNRYVQRALALARREEGEAEPTPEVQSAIEGTRGGGRPLDSGVRLQTESAGPVQRSCACGGQCEQCRANGEPTSLQFTEPASSGATNFRCGENDCPEDEPLLYRDLLGVAFCNTSTGVVDTTVFKEHCAGNCVAQHEAEHAQDLALCCERHGVCMSNAPDLDGRNQCRRAWESWDNLIDDWSECNAYNREGQCLTSLMNAQCRASGTGNVAEDCCSSLQQELDFVTRRISQHCPNATPFPCPFTEDGHIIQGLVP